jgi:hypothetical protein
MTSPLSLPAKTVVLRSYRHLLKAAAFTFAGDAPRLANAIKTSRGYFIQFQHLTEDADIRKMANEAEEAATFLRTQIVQGTYDTQSKKMGTHSISRHLASRNGICDLQVRNSIITIRPYASLFPSGQHKTRAYNREPARRVHANYQGYL